MIDPFLFLRLKRAWAGLTPEQKAAFSSHLDLANAAASQFMDHRTVSQHKGIRHEMMLARSVLDDRQDLLLQHARLALEQCVLGLPPIVNQDGSIWGFGKYEQLDFGWLEPLAALWENIAAGKFFEFGAAPPPILSLPNDQLTLALISDWGTGDWGTDPGDCPSDKIARQITALAPDITIHLGDVYYAGSARQETANLLHGWPAATWGNFTLNSNHEMYPGGVNYHDVALANPLFQMQAGRSCFAIETNHWVIVGLDSAFCADPFSLYLHGTLWPAGTAADASPQFKLIQAAAGRGKPVLLLTHHNPVTTEGLADPMAPLLDQVRQAFAASGKLPVCWYFGHIHIGAVYRDNLLGDGMRLRCIGHGGLPWGYARELTTPAISWFESTAIAASPSGRVANGYAVLRFDGPALHETICTEDGAVSWEAKWA